MFLTHLHSVYSLSDSLITTDKLVKRLNELGMKKVAITDRGNLLHIQEFRKALKNNEIAGAGLDVLLTEPPVNDKITSLENTLVTPHIAWAAKETRARLMEVTKENIKAFVNGNPINVVN